MDIVIYNKGIQKEEGNHYFVDLLEKKLGVYRFLTTAHVHFEELTDKSCKTAIELHPIKGKIIYADATDKLEHGSFNLALAKVLKQVIKYKEMNYRSSNRQQINQ